MNLFWETRSLTQAREDHLTCFIAAALNSDSDFREAYQNHVLGRFRQNGNQPAIASIQTQARYKDEHCRPDMLLVLTDGRRVVCEHKLDAPETLQISANGDAVGQLVRYLALPDINGVAYFRPSLSPPLPDVILHPRYLHPDGAPHFLWRELYEPLTRGEHVLTRWLREGFERLGFTPPVPHVGELWPDDSEQVKQNQRNFGKLWDSTRVHAESHWKVNAGRRCELYLEPFTPQMVSRVYISPLAQNGSLLRLRAETDEANLPFTRQLMESVCAALPVDPEIQQGQLPNTRAFCDLLSPLGLIFQGVSTAEEQASRLFHQVVPVLDKLC